MKHPAILVGSVAVLLAVLIIMAFARHHGKSSDSAEIGSATNHGRVHVGNGYFDNLRKLFFTNDSAFRVTLANPVVQWKKPDGGIVNDGAALWNGESAFISLGTHEVAMLPFDVPTNAQSYRMSCDYDEIGGRSHVHYESPWTANKSLQPTAAAPGN